MTPRIDFGKTIPSDQAACSFGHGHVFLGADQAKNERRTHLVIVLTAVMMALEIAAGLLFGSMALLADGWHMASHASALGIAALAYYLSRRHAHDPRFCFGTGKVGDLAAFSSALLLAGIALLMAYESTRRLIHPVTISFGEAIVVAVLGLAVNLVSALVLDQGDGHHHDRDAHDHDRHGHHDHDHEDDDHDDHDHAAHPPVGRVVDHNLRAAYIHVMADALTSVLAIAALVLGRYLGWAFMDPLMGVVGAVVISRWSYGLLKDSGRVLLDMTPDPAVGDRIRQAIESSGDGRVTDLHLWRVGPGHWAAIISVVSAQNPPPDHFKSLLGRLSELSHVTVEVNPEPGTP
jgi:cation diffusion facilitator family transporter